MSKSYKAMTFFKSSQWFLLLTFSCLVLYAGPEVEFDGAADGLLFEKLPGDGPSRGRKHPKFDENKKRGAESKAFKKADKNTDGSLSFDEFSSLERLAHLDEAKRKRIFNFLDKNSDGLIHFRELHPGGERRNVVLLKHFEKLDTNGNGAIDFEEFKKSALAEKMPAKQLRHHFEKMDGDGSGDLDRREIKRSGPRGHHPIQFRKFDKDKNGSLSFEEYSLTPFINRFSEQKRREMFERIDKDHDGRLSLEEIRAARRTSPHGNSRRKGHRPMRAE